MQVLESAFLNVYCGLNLYKFGVPLWDVLGSWRQGSLPQFKVSQAAGLAAGIVNTPPPFYMMKYGPCTPTPKGKCHICIVKIRKGIRELENCIKKLENYVEKIRKGIRGSEILCVRQEKQFYIL